MIYGDTVLRIDTERSATRFQFRLPDRTESFVVTWIIVQISTDNFRSSRGASTGVEKDLPVERESR